jgi:curved DNA-binding protein CbpA
MLNLNLIEDPYKTLGVERSAAEAEIKQAYFALVREHSPERDPEGFKRIRAAYEKLRAVSDRATTDLLLIDESDDAASLPAYGVEPPPLTREQIQSDLIALEALLLVDDASAFAAIK